MSTFDNVTVDIKANVYFGGNVTSRTITFASGEVKTLGIMMPGEYTFNTGKAEIMDITSGNVEYRLADSEEWHAVTGGEKFDVPANSSFDIKVTSTTDYICSFIN